MYAVAKSHPIIEELARQLTSSQDALRYIFAGKATFTLRSVETGKRYTYKITRVPDKGADKFWVSLMYGPNNEADFKYLGMHYPVVKDYALQLGRTSTLPKESQPVRAFEFIIQWLRSKPFITPKIEIWHSGRCGRCGKKLTVPSSIALGIGPDCATKGGY